MNIEVPTEAPPQRKVKVHRTGLDYAALWAVIGLFAIAGIAVLNLASFILIPLTFAVVVGLILGLAADRLGAMGIPPMLTAAILSGLFVGIVILLVSIIAGPLNMLIRNAPEMIENTLQYLESISWLERPVQSLLRGPGSADNIMEHTGTILSTLATGVTPALLQIMIFAGSLLLFLSSRLTLRRAMIRVFTNRPRRLAAIRMINQVEAVLGYYFATAIAIYSSFGLIAALIAWVGGLGSPLLWGVASFLLSFVPFLGIAMVTVAIAIAGLMVHETMFYGLLPAIAFFLVNAVYENLLIPSVMGRRLEMNSYMLFVAIVFWTWLWGAVGAMLAVPLTVICMTLLGNFFPPGTPKPNLPD